MRLQKRHSFLDSDPIRKDPIRKEWSPPSLERVALTSDELSRIRLATDPAETLRQIYLLHKIASTALSQ